MLNYDARSTTHQTPILVYKDTSGMTNHMKKVVFDTQNKTSKAYTLRFTKASLKTEIYICFGGSTYQTKFMF